LHAKVVSSVSLTFEDLKMAADGSVELIAGTLKAWLNRQPGSGGGNGTLLVTVEAEAGDGVRAGLESASPQGTNPAVKLLKVNREKPVLVGADVMPVGADAKVKMVKNPYSTGKSKLHLRYEEAPAKETYTDVTIENGSNTISAKVETVS
jgi:hypothetical protein